MTITALLNMAALVAALYICGAAVCRVRHARSSMRPVWLIMYVEVFALAAWLAAESLAVGVSAWSALTAVTIALYVRMTAGAWINGVPAIARREPANPFPDTRLPEGQA